MTGIIKDIPALLYTKSKKHFTIKNVDKRISTLKSLAPKKGHGSIKNKLINDVNNKTLVEIQHKLLLLETEQQDLENKYADLSTTGDQKQKVKKIIKKEKKAKKKLVVDKEINVMAMFVELIGSIK